MIPASSINITEMRQRSRSITLEPDVEETSGWLHVVPY